MGSSAKNYAPNGDTLIVGGVINVIGDGEIQKDGVPIDIGGGGGPSSVAWGDITGKPAVIAAGADAAAARTAIGAGTSSQNLPTLSAANATAGTATTASAITAAVLAGAIDERTKSKAQIATLTPIVDPGTAQAEDVATLLNTVIAALKA